MSRSLDATVERVIKQSFRLKHMTETPAKAAGAFAPVAFVFLGGIIIGVVVNLFFPLPIWPSPWVRLIGPYRWPLESGYLPRRE